MKALLKQILPSDVYNKIKASYYFFVKKKLLILGRGPVRAETTKAKERRIREGFFDNYCQGTGLDIGYGGDLVHPSAVGWDFEHGDAQTISSVASSGLDYVYSSHTLEHMTDSGLALRNWWRVVKPGGYLILYIPERDLYEKKTQLPSNWNLDHKHYFLLESDEQPATLGILPLISRELRGYRIVYAKVCKDNYVSDGPDVHSLGEYSIEVVLQKMSS